MSRRGPIPGTTGYTPRAVAAVANEAHAQGRNIAQTVAAHFGCTLPAARSAISRARRDGHPIPYDYGYTAPDGTWQQTAKSNPQWSANVHRAARLNAQRRRRAKAAPRPPQPRAERPFNPPRSTGQPHTCTTCGHQAPTGWELAGHTLDHHGRPLVAAERTPQQVAA